VNTTPITMYKKASACRGLFILFIQESGTCGIRINGTLKIRISGTQNTRKIEAPKKEK